MGKIYPGEKEDPMAMRVREIDAFLDTELEVGEAFRLVGLRSRTFARRQRDGSVWLVGQIADGERQLAVELEDLAPADGKKKARFKASFGPTGSEVWATAVLAVLVRASIGPEEYEKFIRLPGRVLDNLVMAASRSMVYDDVHEGMWRPRYRIKTVA